MPRSKGKIILKDPPGGHFREVRFYCLPGARETDLPTLEAEARRIVAEYGLLPKKQPRKERPGLLLFFAGIGVEALTFLLVGLLLRLFS